LGTIADRFEKADRRGKRAQVLDQAGEREAAETERWEAAGEGWKAGQDLADLLCLLFRYALQHRSDALKLYVRKVLEADLRSLEDAVARLEDR
jgi:hypothetical protein